MKSENGADFYSCCVFSCGSAVSVTEEAGFYIHQEEIPPGSFQGVPGAKASPALGQYKGGKS